MLNRVLKLLKCEKVLTAHVVADKLKISRSKAEILIQILIDQGVVQSAMVRKSSCSTKCEGNCKLGL